MALTAHAKTVDALLRNREDNPISLAEFIGELRDMGLSYARIAAQLSKATGGVVQISGETIRNWINDLEAEQVAS